MNPVDLNIIEKKKSIILRDQKLAKELLKKRLSQQSDLYLQHALCYAVQNIISAVIDIAQHIVAEKSNQVPESYAHAIERLGDLKILPRKFAHDFSQAAKLRNVIVHAYTDLDVDTVVKLAPKLIRDVGIFLRAIGSKVTK